MYEVTIRWDTTGNASQIGPINLKRQSFETDTLAEIIDNSNNRIIENLVRRLIVLTTAAY